MTDENNEYQIPAENYDLTNDDETAKDHDENSRHGYHHYHHHHHHHRRHKSHRHGGGRHCRKSGSSRKKVKLGRFLEKNRSVLVNVVACTISVVLLIIMAVQYEHRTDEPNHENGVVEPTKASIGIESTIFTDDVLLVHPAITAYTGNSDGKKAKEIYSEYGGRLQNMDGGRPMKYSYRITGIPSGVTVKQATLTVGLNEALRDAQIYSFANDAGSVEIYHLLPGTTYYYRLDLLLSTGNTVGTTGSFTTVASPRILRIDGINNVRDIGGWETSSGQRIKYGLLYRGSELDGGVEPTYLLTEAGLIDMVKNLGIRFDMDLRANADNNGDALGASVVHKNYPIGYYAEILNDANAAYIRDIFADLANPANYPIYLHCTYGRDRTGTVCYLLEALLGVPDENLRKEYELTTFAQGSVALEDFAIFTTRISMLEGSSTQKKVENYLLSIGVTAEEIASIRDIFLN